MTLTHLNQSLLDSPALPVTRYGNDLVKSIRESLLLHRPEPLRVPEQSFRWLLSLTETKPTATTNGVQFVRVQSGENFVDVINNQK